MLAQYLEKCENLLVAARGSSISLFSLENGSHLSTWECPTPQQSANDETTVEENTSKAEDGELESSSVTIGGDTSIPPAKRRKLSPEHAEEEKPGVKEKVIKGKKQKNQGNRSKYISHGSELPAVIALAVTKTSQHVVAITGEDKCIRVFEVLEQDRVAKLNQISQRVMPKRPSALAITEDGSTIISADKFGDVYSLPLLPSNSLVNQDSKQTSQSSEKPFKPAANELTIHSERNRRALENQKRQIQPAEKSGPAFEHQLLLGHVSLLTDVALASLNGKNYIITADRDEHIRVSRGIPQSHIIESFCLGHTVFISRICIPQERPDILISGGGDDHLFVWRWETGKLISTLDVKSLIQHYMLNLTTTGRKEGGTDDNSKEQHKFAVSGVHYYRDTFNPILDLILTTFQGIPALFIFSLTPENTLQHMQTLDLPGNALAVVTNAPTEGRIIVSIDNIHKPGSITECRDATEAIADPLQVYVLEDLLWRLDKTFKMEVEQESKGINTNTETSLERLRNLLYSLENLRKRDTMDGGANELETQENGTGQDDSLAQDDAA